MPIAEPLQHLAARLAQLTAHEDKYTTPLNFAFGAIYALGIAETLSHDYLAEGGRGQRMWRSASTIAQNLSEGGELPRQGDWLAGYFFNDGIIRIAVSFEHIVRHVTGKHGGENIDKLIEAAIPLGFQEQWGRAWRPLQNELNAIRHRNDFVDGPQQEVTYPFAVDALERLIEALDWGCNMPPVKGNVSSHSI